MCTPLVYLENGQKLINSDYEFRMPSLSLRTDGFDQMQFMLNFTQIYQIRKMFLSE